MPIFDLLNENSFTLELQTNHPSGYTPLTALSIDFSFPYTLNDPIQQPKTPIKLFTGPSGSALSKSLFLVYNHPLSIFKGSR